MLQIYRKSNQAGSRGWRYVAPKDMVFESLWSEIGHRFLPLWSKSLKTGCDRNWYGFRSENCIFWSEVGWGLENQATYSEVFN